MQINLNPIKYLESKNLKTQLLVACIMSIKRSIKPANKKATHDNTGLKTLAHAIRNILYDNKFRNCINYNDKKRMENIIEKTIDWIDANLNANIEEFEVKKKQLEQVWIPVITQAYTFGNTPQCPECLTEKQSKQTDINNNKSEYIQQLMDQNSSLRLQLAKQQRESKKQISELKFENDTLKNKLQLKDKELNKWQDDYKELEIKLKQKMQHITYKSWQYNDVFEWIINIENKRFKKYENKLFHKLKEECIDGTCLNEMDANDLHRLGITQFKDKKVLMKYIEKLIRQNVENNMNDNDEGAPTGYIL
eukprot:268648_1